MAQLPKPWWSKDTVAVVTGANKPKGIGLEIVRQLAQNGLTVVLTARDEGRGQAALDALKAEGLESVSFHQLDISSAESVEQLADWLKQKYGGIDILINNAAVGAPDFNVENAKWILDTNYFGTAKVIEGLLRLLRTSPAGARIVNITSRMGQYERLPGESLKEQFRDPEKYTQELANSLATKYLEDVEAGGHLEQGWLPADKTPMYSESKLFTNVYSAGLAKALWKSQPEDHRIFVTSTCPGIVETDMLRAAIDGGFVIPAGYTPKTPQQGADTAVWLALLPKEELVEKNGKLFGERKEYSFSLRMNF